jgi:protoporphyrinogen/coproporphyrinogen III oxidase
MRNHRVVIIGAGISGLVCGYRLTKLGMDPLVLERSQNVGGVIQSESIDGYLIERGPNSSQGTAELLQLVEELGITDQLVEGDSKAPAFVYFRSKLHPVPSGPGAFLKSKLLTVGGKLRIFKEPFVSARNSDSEESVAGFARRRIGDEAAERLVAPFVAGIYAGDAERLSVQAAFPRLANLEANYGGLFRGMIAKAGEARRAKKDTADVLNKAAPTPRRLCSFREGMATLPKKLAQNLGENLLTGCNGMEVQRDSSSPGFNLTFKHEGNQHHISFSHLIIATPATTAALLTESFSTELSQLLNEVEYPPLSILSVAYDAQTIDADLRGFGFLVPPSEGLEILGCVWNSSLFEGRAPKGKVLLTVFVGGARNPRVASAPDAELASTAHRELQRVLGISSEPQVVAITRYERSIPQYNIGHFARVKRIDELVRGLGNVRLVGNYLHGVSTGDCIKQADRIAKEISEETAKK